jgi:2,3-bisphosphoglycerate-dependent phosphoglycerate mutase
MNENMKASLEDAKIVEGSRYEAMPTAFLIRHGESESNAGLPTIQPKYVRLTSLGCEQAKRTADCLKYYPLELIVTSPYLRTKQTAEPTAFVFYDTPERAITEDEWQVQEFTYLSSMRWTYSTTEDRRPEVDRYWKDADPDYVDGPGSESFREFIDRVRAFLEQLKNVEEEYETIAVFSHEQFINAVLWLIDYDPVEISSKTMRDFRTYLDGSSIQNGAIVQIRFSHHENRWRSEWITQRPSLKRAVPGPEPARVEEPELVGSR